MQREKILQAATDLFARHGMKGVSISQIASELGISKKDIYAEFADKDDLVVACIAREIERVGKAALKVLDIECPVPEKIMLVGSDIFRHHASRCQAFYKDIDRFPGAKRLVDESKMRMRGRFIDIFRKGVEDGYFVDTLEYGLVSSVYIDQFTSMKYEYQPTMIVTFLRGISTTKGMEELDRVIRANQYV